MRLGSPTIRAKLMGFAAVAIIMLAILGAAALAGLSHVGGSISGVTNALETVRQVVSVQKGLVDIEAASAAYLQGAGEQNLDQYRAGDKTARTGLVQLKRLAVGKPAQERRVQEAEAILSKWEENVVDPAIAARRKSKDSGARAEEKSTGSKPSDSLSHARMGTVLLDLTKDQMALSDNYLSAAAGWLAKMRTTAYAGVPACAILILVASFLLAGHISRPISDAASLAEGIRRGELSQRISAKGLDEARRLTFSLNDMADSLADYNRRIIEGVNVLTDSVGQIASTASELFASSSQTVSAVTETTAIVNEMASAAKVVNETARGVADHSQHSDEIANSGAKATSDTVEKMNLIREKMGIVSEAVLGLSDNTKYVEDIIAAVQDLADQSNLLAVNASIEAARAGEHGKGFAVVAQEIKSLADQSREATARVTKILQEIRKSVGSVVMATEEGGKAVLSGVEQSEAAGRSIEKLAESIAEFSKAAGVIFSSSGGQFSRVERVATAMKHVELATNNNVEGTTQLENEARRLEQLALSLKGMVSRYTTSQQTQT